VRFEEVSTEFPCPILDDADELARFLSWHRDVYENFFAIQRDSFI